MTAIYFLVVLAVLVVPLFLVVALRQWANKIPPSSSTTSGTPPPPSMWGKVKGWIGKTGAWASSLPILLIITLVVMYTWREGWAKVPWNWILGHGLLSLTVVGFIAWFALNKGVRGKITAKGLKDVAIVVAILWVCFNLGGCFRHMAEEHPCPFTAPNAVAEERARKAEEIPPNEIRFGSWEVPIAQGEWGPWILFHRGTSTSVEFSTPTEIQMGKIRGRQVVPSDDPPRVYGSSREVIWLPGDAARHRPTESNVTLKVTRGNP